MGGENALQVTFMVGEKATNVTEGTDELPQVGVCDAGDTVPDGSGFTLTLYETEVVTTAELELVPVV
jgi:hypothetical protein